MGLTGLKLWGKPETPRINTSSGSQTACNGYRNMVIILKSTSNKEPKDKESGQIMCKNKLKQLTNMEDFPYSQWFSLNKNLSSMLPKSIKDKKINMPILHNEKSKIFPEREIVRMSGKGRFKNSFYKIL